jgi:hypothetical protein
MKMGSYKLPLTFLESPGESYRSDDECQLQEPVGEKRKNLHVDCL